MRIDLHTHSRVSDGTDAPSDIVWLARRAGLDVVALTDHDTADGWASATAAGLEAGVAVVRGMEISTEYRGVGVHLLGYELDPSLPPLAAELAHIRSDRRDRLGRISARLTAAGYPLEVDDILATAHDASTVGRPHVADAMIAKGYVRTRDEAFARWLADGGPGYAPKYAPSTADAIALVRAAGGVSVLAHPWGRGSRRVLDGDAFEDLARAGLDGIEVDHQDHDAVDRAELRGLAHDLDLAVTGSSDYHGVGKFDHELGINTTEPAHWERLASLAAQRAAEVRR